MGWVIYSGIEKHGEKSSINDMYTEMKYSSITFRLTANSRFSKDKVISKKGNYLFLHDGVLLNKEELLKKRNKQQIEELICDMYCAFKEEYMQHFRGPFTGAVYDNARNKLIAYCNQTGDTAVFYYYDRDKFCISTDFNTVAQYMEDIGAKPTFSIIAAKYMLSYGYLPDNHTFIEEITRLDPGKYLVIENGSLCERQYHKFNNDRRLDIKDNEVVSYLDDAFRKSVVRCFNKDIEYGFFEHLVDMSGGFDSRMVNWIAHEEGYTNIVNMHYSKADSNEEHAARACANELKNSLLHMQLDNAKFFLDIDEIILKNYGMAVYCGITGGYRFLKYLSNLNFGLEHTGQLGDVIIGSYCKKISRNVDRESIYYSNRLGYEFNVYNKYENQEMYSLYCRGFHGVLSTHFVRRHFFEAVSPFIDVDLIEFCLSIPLEGRANHNLYKKWLSERYPKAMMIQSTRGLNKIDSKSGIRRIVKDLLGDKWPAVKSALLRAGMNSKTMNPLDYILYRNNLVKLFMDKYYVGAFNAFAVDKALKHDIAQMYYEGSVMEKALAVTVLGVYKNYFLEKTYRLQNLLRSSGGRF